MKVSVETRDAGTVIKLEGQIAIGEGVSELRAALARLSSADSPRVVVDLQDVTFVDSAGLGELVAACQRSRQHGGHLCVARPRAKVADLIHLTRIDELIPVYDDLAAALTAVGGDHSSNSV